MAKDRARPFSRKHRKYWIPITGGMLLIGVINLGLGFCAYTPPPPPPQRIALELPPPGARVLPDDGSIQLGQVPAAVMRAFAVAFPRNVPRGAKKLVGRDGAVTYEIAYAASGGAGSGSAAQHATFREDGTLVPAR